jgi:TonB-dependent SusC/RagA subfamily outer membrane receptor
MSKKILFLFISVLYINSISAQKPARRVEITGTVLDVYNGPIANAIIMIDNQKTNSVTNSRGIYKIKVKPGALKIGVFTFGNGIFEENIDGRTRINFSFKSIAAHQSDPNLRDGEQGVNTGYGMVRKKNLVTDISKIDGTSKNYSGYSSLTEMIQREVSGVQVVGNDVIIQGSTNYYGYVRPLIVVDGVYMDNLPDLPPVTVKSIEVLKGTSAAIYGSRGYGGAIIIKTKIQND